jgi:putative sugar O-methyltransferase
MLPLLLNDSVGDPETIAIPGIGRVTGSSLRYANVTMDLVAHFGELEGMVINEVGVGYGGQCRIIKRMFPTVQYRLIDLASVLPLAKRYLTESGVGDGLEFIAAESGPRVSGDLFISNYAFSELRRGNQEAYLRDVALKCSRGYAIYNAITPRTFKSLSAQAFARRAGGHIGDEEPLSYPGNCLVWWDKHRSAE